MTSILISIIWLLLTDSQPTIKKPVQLEHGSIGVWTGPKILLNKQNRGTEEFQISQSVQNILQDKSGTFWIGTGKDGVCLFDGTNYSYFTTKEGLTGNSVRTILQDRNGDVWIATNGGITRRNKQGLYAYTTANGLPDNEVLTLHMDKKG